MNSATTRSLNGPGWPGSTRRSWPTCSTGWASAASRFTAESARCGPEAKARRLRPDGANRPGPRARPRRTRTRARWPRSIRSRAGDVLVVSKSAWSFWGELLSTAAQYRGCRGVVIDGSTRDTLAIMAMGFPVFRRGFHPADSLGRLDVAAHDVPDPLRRRARPSGRPDPGRRRRRRGRPARRRRGDAAARGGEGARREPRPQGAAPRG